MKDSTDYSFITLIILGLLLVVSLSTATTLHLSVAILGLMLIVGTFCMKTYVGIISRNSIESHNIQMKQHLQTQETYTQTTILS